jgi:hypothetical protein
VQLKQTIGLTGIEMPELDDYWMDLVIPTDISVADASEACERARSALARALEEQGRLRIDLDEGRPTAVSLQLLIASVKSAAIKGRLGELGPGARVALAKASGILEGDQEK